MCGIWASIGPQVSRSHIDVIAHRGPDAEGWLTSESPAGTITIGHRRLAILDLSDAGRQPMETPDGRFVITFNGEIYNHRELRAELEADGITFRSTCDTEVLLHAFAKRGPSCLNSLLGMFAFVIFDRAERKLWLVRDRFGIKPLYLVETKDGIAIASEIKQFLEFPGFQPKLNRLSAFDFMISGYLDTSERTMFENVRQLEPGTLAVIDVGTDNPNPKIDRWYELPSPGSLALDFDSAASMFGELLEDSVRLHLESDVTVGSCLSGGLDSSALVCLMRRIVGSEGSIETVTARYAHARVDEGDHAAVVARAANTIGHETRPCESDVFDLAKRITWHQDEPYGSTSIFAQWCVFEKAAANGLKVMLDGQGADEQLGGYHTMIPIREKDLLRNNRYLEFIFEILGGRIRHRTPISTALGRNIPGSFLPSLSRRITKDGDPSDWLRSPMFSDLTNIRSPMMSALERAGLGHPDSLGTWCEALTKCLNVTTLLHWEDRNSMAHSIESRVPFLDHRLVEFSIGLGDHHKIRRGVTKAVLRSSMRNVLPESIRNRHDKLGFATPESEWFRGPLRSKVVSGVEQTLARLPDLLDPDATRQRRDRMLDGSQALDFSLWRVISIGIWADVFDIET